MGRVLAKLLEYLRECPDAAQYTYCVVYLDGLPGTAHHFAGANRALGPAYAMLYETSPNDFSAPNNATY